MCGRFVTASSSERIAEFFGASFDAAADPVRPNYNVAPTTEVRAVTADASGARVLQPFRWGLVPSWATDATGAAKMINARAETVASKPVFKGLFRKHRLLVPMDGFYEWQRADGTKRPMFIHRADGEPLAIAGLWAAWRDPAAPEERPWLHSCALITTAANQMMSAVHDRMPVILPRSVWDRWLDPTNQDVGDLHGMLRAAPERLLTMHEVSPAVNSVRNNFPELVEALPA